LKIAQVTQQDPVSKEKKKKKTHSTMIKEIENTNKWKVIPCS
jgi:hypothetical protein